MSIYTLVRGQGVRQVFTRQLASYVCDGLNAAIHDQLAIRINGTEILPTEVGHKREYNRHKTGENYFNRHVNGTLESSAAGPSGQIPISFDGNWYSEGSKRSGGLVYQQVSIRTQTHSVLLGARYAITSGKATYSVDKFEHVVSTTIQPEESWIQPSAFAPWWRAGSFRVEYYLNVPYLRTYQLGSEEACFTILRDMAHDFATLTFEEAVARHCTNSVAAKVESPEIFVFKGDLSQLQPVFDSTFARFSRVLSYDALHVDDRLGLCQAYLEAVKGIPSLSGMDNMENAIQIVKLAKDIIMSKGRPSKMSALPKDIANLWLATRYSLGTSMSDIDEVKRYTDRAIELINSVTLKSDGYFRRDDVTYHVVCTWTPQGLTTLQSWPERAGIDARASHLWDLVPYSFVVDWFLQIGSLLDFEESRILSLKAQPADCWMSIEKSGKNVFGGSQSEYVRLHGIPTARDVAFLPEYVWYDPSGRVVAKHAADAAALFIPQRN